MSQNETSGAVAVDNQKIKTKQMVLIALMTAVTCVLGPLSIPLPFSPVPISLTNFAIFLAIFVLGMKNGTISFIIYLLLGAVGVPVFSSFRGGLQVLAGPGICQGGQPVMSFNFGAGKKLRVKEAFRFQLTLCSCYTCLFWLLKIGRASCRERV